MWMESASMETMKTQICPRTPGGTPDRSLVERNEAERLRVAAASLCTKRAFRLHYSCAHAGCGFGTEWLRLGGINRGSPSGVDMETSGPAFRGVLPAGE